MPAGGDIGALLALPKEIAGAIGDVLATVSLGKVAPGMAMAVQPIESFVGKFVKTLTGLLSPFERITDLAAHFVQGFDPALVQNLAMRFKDLNAVIGIALRPIVDVARDVVKSLSDHLLPIMKKLEPIVRDLAQTIAANLISAFDELSNLLEDMLPFLTDVKDALKVLFNIFHDLTYLFDAVRHVLLQFFNDLFGVVIGQGGLKSIMEQLRTVIQHVIVAIIQFMAQLFVLIGWVKGLNALKGAFEKRAANKEESTGTAVSQNPAFKAIGDLAKSAQLAMFAASGQGVGEKTGVEKSNEFLKEIQDGIKRGEEAGKRNKAEFDRYVEEIKTEIHNVVEKIDKAWDWLENDAWNDVQNVYEPVVNLATDIGKIIKGEELTGHVSSRRARRKSTPGSWGT